MRTSNQRCLNRTNYMFGRNFSATSERYLLLASRYKTLVHSEVAYMLRHFDQVVPFKRRATTFAHEKKAHNLCLGHKGDHAFVRMNTRRETDRNQNNLPDTNVLPFDNSDHLLAHQYNRVELSCPNKTENSMVPGGTTYARTANLALRTFSC